MKKIILLVAVGIYLSNLSAQNMNDLLLDSTYGWTCYPYYDHFELGYGTNDCTNASASGGWNAYSYDDKDRLIQIRRPDSYRHSYTYSQDTIFQWNEKRDSLGNWDIWHRETKTYRNGKITSKLGHLYVDNEWINPHLVSYEYNDLGLEILELRQNWLNEEWVSAYKKEKKYDSKGNLLEESEYYEYEWAGDNDTLEFSRGKLYEYDANGNLTKRMKVQNRLDWKRFISDYTTWIYGNDQLLDSMIYYQRLSNPDRYVSYSYCTYEHIENNVVIENQYHWYDDSIKWRNDGKKITYNMGNDYNDNPDSVVHYYMNDSLTLAPKIKYYYEIVELPGDSVYFKNTEYVYYDEDGDWSLTSVGEKWYHRKTYTLIKDNALEKQKLTVYPNPCYPDQELYLKENVPDKTNLTVSIFDLNGRLISKYHNSGKAFKAPDRNGTYIMFFSHLGKVIGSTKQIVY